MLWWDRVRALVVVATLLLRSILVHRIASTWYLLDRPTRTGSKSQMPFLSTGSLFAHLVVIASIYVSYCFVETKHLRPRPPLGKMASVTASGKFALSTIDLYLYSHDKTVVHLLVHLVCDHLSSRYARRLCLIDLLTAQLRGFTRGICGSQVGYRRRAHSYFILAGTQPLPIRWTASAWSGLVIWARLANWLHVRPICNSSGISGTFDDSFSGASPVHCSLPITVTFVGGDKVPEASSSSCTRRRTCLSIALPL
jgi:hypothetical protein